MVACVLLLEGTSEPPASLLGALSAEGLALREARSGEDALRLVEDGADILLVGGDAARTLRGEPRAAPVPILDLPRGGVDPRVFAGAVKEVVRARRAAEAEHARLRQARSLDRRVLETVLEQLPIGVAVAELPDGRFVHRNAAVARLIRRELPPYGPTWDVSARTADGELLARDALPLLRALRGESVQGLELHLERGDGTAAVLEVSAAPVRDATGAIVAAAATIIDRTERHASEKEREELVRELQAALHARDEFLSIVSHDVRSPLTGVLLTLETLVHAIDRGKADALTPERLKNRLNATHARVRELLDMLDVLLDASRLGAGAVSLRPEPLDLAAVLRELCDRWRDPLAKAGSALELRAPGPVVGSWDRVRLEQMVSNLLSNAAKYGAGAPVTVTVDTVPGRARIEVRDGGPGIAAEDQERIFERFERARPRAATGSFGLGLWIARRIARAMRGDLRVESALGEGSAFTIDLPA